MFFEEFISLTNSINSKTEKHEVLLESCEKLNKFCINNGFYNLFLSFNKQEDITIVSPQLDSLVTLIGSLPDRVSNRLKFNAPKYLRSRSWFSSVITQLLNSLEYSSISNISLSSVLISKICHLGYSNIVIKIMLPYLLVILDSENEKKDILKLYRQIFNNLSLPVVESFLFELLTQLGSYSDSNDGSNIKTNNSISRVIPVFFDDILVPDENFKSTPVKLAFRLCFTHKFLIVRQLENQALFILLSSLWDISKNQKDNNIIVSSGSSYVNSFLNASITWSDSLFISRSATSLHRYITNVLLKCLSFLPANENGASILAQKDILSNLLSGVHSRMSSPNLSIRKLGMTIAENFSLILSPDNPLNFDTSNSDDESELFSQIEDQSIIDKSEITNELDEDDLQPHITTLREDKETNNKDIPTPIYIRECLALLRKPDDADSIDIVLDQLTKIIRSRPDDLAQVSIDLCKSLLCLNNRYNLPKFLPRKLTALTALSSSLPDKIAPLLIAELFAENYSISDRINILHVLAHSASELSSLDVDKNRGTVGTPALPIKSNQSLPGPPSNTQSLPITQIPSKSKLKSRTKYYHHIGPMNQFRNRNRFAPYAGVFFFSLISSYKNSRINFFDNEALLLTEIILVLGHFIECAGQSCIRTRDMSQSMLEILWVIRYHSECSVRRASLYVLSRILFVLPSFIFIDSFQNDIYEIANWVAGIKQDDSDDECRIIATACALCLKTVIEDSGLVPVL